MVRGGGQVDDCRKRQRRRKKRRRRRRKWPRNRRVALITGSSWVIVYVTESNQRLIGFSVAATHQNILPATWETLIRQPFVDEKPVGKTNNLGSAWWYGITCKKPARAAPFIDLALTASVQIVFVCFTHLKADVEIVHPQRYYATIHKIRVDMRVSLSACKHTEPCITSGLMGVCHSEAKWKHTIKPVHNWCNVGLFHFSQHWLPCFNHQSLSPSSAIYFLQWTVQNHTDMPTPVHILRLHQNLNWFANVLTWHASVQHQAHREFGVNGVQNTV